MRFLINILAKVLEHPLYCRRIATRLLFSFFGDHNMTNLRGFRMTASSHIHCEVRSDLGSEHVP